MSSLESLLVHPQPRKLDLPDSMDDSPQTQTPKISEQGADLFAPVTRAREVQVISRPSLSYWQDAWLRLKKNKQAFTSLVMLSLIFIFTMGGSFVWKMDPSEQDLNRVSEPPGNGGSVVVLGELLPYQEMIFSDQPEKTETPGLQLAAPTGFQISELPSIQSVRLKWNPVAGASGYAIYRAEQKPTESSGDLGLPIADLQAGNIGSYEDLFNLKAKTYYYSIVAKGADGEASAHASLDVTLTRSMTLSDALQIKPDAQAGQTLQLRSHPLGTDYIGRDLLARLIQGGKVSLFIGLVAPLIATFLGVFIGGIAGFMGGRVDEWLMRSTDFVTALPFLLFMILFKVVFGNQAGESGISAMLTAMICLTWTGPARLTRGQVLQLRESEFVHAARLLGARSSYLVLRHLLPNSLGVILVSLTFSIPTAIFTEAFLSFIGMGVVPPTPSWGSMCNDGIQTFLTHPHEFIFPAIIISLTVLAFNLFGDGLRDALDPKQRSR